VHWSYWADGSRDWCWVGTQLLDTGQLQGEQNLRVSSTLVEGPERTWCTPLEGVRAVGHMLHLQGLPSEAPLNTQFGQEGRVPRSPAILCTREGEVFQL